MKKRSICPKHWQLPRIGTDDNTSPDNAKTFYDLLFAYQWSSTGSTDRGNYGPNIWSTSDRTYHIWLEPFYAVNMGQGSYYSGGLAYVGIGSSLWSNKPSSDPIYTTIFSQDRKYTWPAYHNFWRLNLFPLRCLTQ